MDAVSILNILLPAVFVVVGIALVWFLVELVRTLKSARTMVDDLNKHLTPTMAHIETMTGELAPAMERVNPLVERLSLTVDAANLELMRVDTILENVGDISGSLSNTTTTIDKVAQAPMKVVTSVSDRVRKAMGSPRASDEATRLAENASAEVDLQEDDLKSADSPFDLAGAQDAEEAQEEKRYYTYAPAAATAATAAAAEAVASDPIFDEQSTGEIPPIVDEAPAAVEEAAAEVAEVAEVAEEAAVEVTEVAEEAAAEVAEVAEVAETVETAEVAEATEAFEPVETTEATEAAPEQSIDFSSFFNDAAQETAAVEQEVSTEVAGLEGVLDDIVVPEAEVAPVVVEEEAPAAPAAPDTDFVPASDLIATTDPVEIVTEEDPAALADQLASAFATPAEQPTGPMDAVDAVADAIQDAAADVAGAADASTAVNYTSDDLTAVDAALAAARARIASKIGGASSGELFSVSAELPPEIPADDDQ